MQTSSRRAGASFDGLTISPLPVAMCAALSPWQRSQVMPSCAKSGMSYLFSVPAMGAREALVWQLRQPGYAGRFIGMNFASWKAGAVSQTFFLRVPVDGGFEEETVEGEKIGAAAVTGADEVLEAACAVHGGIVGAIEGEHGGVVFGVDAIVDAGSGVGEVGGSELVDGLAAGAGHGGLGVGGGDGGVAFGASFVAGGVEAAAALGEARVLFASRPWRV